MARFKGFRNKDTFIIHQWVSNDETYYKLAKAAKKKARDIEMQAHLLKQSILEMQPSIGGLFWELIHNSIETADWEEIANEVA